MIDTVSENDLGVQVDGHKTRYVLRLYITRNTFRAQQALRNIKKICEEELHDGYDLEVIDIFQQPELARQDQVLAAPTLIRKHPLPVRKLVGDLSNRDKVVVGLEIMPEGKAGKEGIK
jgi:circadian clock protein KaiB